MRRLFFCATLISRAGEASSVRRSPVLQRTGDGGNSFRQLFGDTRRRSQRAEEIRVLKKVTKQFDDFGIVNPVVGEFVNLLNRAVKIGFDDVAVEIANDEQWRIEQRFAVTEQLLVSLVEVLFLALVFPAKQSFFQTSAKPRSPARVVVRRVERAVRRL